MLNWSRFASKNIKRYFSSVGYENPLKEYYKILGVEQSATMREIKNAFKEKCKRINLELSSDGISNQVYINN